MYKLCMHLCSVSTGSARVNVQGGFIQHGGLAVEALGGALLVTGEAEVVGGDTALPAEVLLASRTAVPAQQGGTHVACKDKHMGFNKIKDVEITIKIAIITAITTTITIATAIAIGIAIAMTATINITQ